MTVRLEQQGGCAVLTLDRQEALNALSFAILDQISDALDKVPTMKVSALIITGAGTKAFCAGADIKELQNRNMDAHYRGVRLGQGVFAKLDALPVASIAAINGFAFGGGLELALACTFRVATRTAKMGLPEIKLGLIPGYGGTQRLPKAIGTARALDLIMTGRAIDAEEAERIGLVGRLTDGSALEMAFDLAGTLAAYSLPVLRMAREAVLRSADTTLSEGLKIEADLATLAFQTADSIEGIDAFVNKRKAEFRHA